LAVFAFLAFLSFRDEKEMPNHLSTINLGVGGSLGDSVVRVTELIVVEPEKMKNGCMQVWNPYAVNHGFVAEFIRFAIEVNTNFFSYSLRESMTESRVRQRLPMQQRF
jgi:hypothetical protein